MAAMMVAASSSATLSHHFSIISPSKWKSRSPSTSVCFAMRREREVTIDVAEEERSFVYRRASAAERWPNTSDEFQQRAVREETKSVSSEPQVPPSWGNVGVKLRDREEDEGEELVSPIYRLMREDKARDKAREREISHQPQRDQTKKLKRMNKLALKRAVDWKDRTRRLTAAICELELARPVADVLEGWPEQLNNEDLTVVLGNVGRENWRRALELYECLNLRKWYTPNTRMLATILGILGRSNQVEVARELFLRAEPELTADNVQVFNGIMSVYAKQGKWQAVQQILELMESKGCEPDIITFNTVINARCKGELQPGMAIAFLKEIRRARLKPDLITFNTLLGGCIANKNFTEAREVVKEMVRGGYEPDAYSKYLLGKEKKLLHEMNLDSVNKGRRCSSKQPEADTFEKVLFICLLEKIMATLKNLKIKTGVCKRVMKELDSYQAEADSECVKTDNMKNSHADSFDIKQQERVLAESCLMISNCRKRLETSLAAVEAAVVEAEAETTAEESEELSTALDLVAQVKPLFAA